ncbi:MAG: glyoxylate/hydroxypyruvate reductase [Rubritepida sp.]|nr:glyoxylate/hydroxypyruvate reductase [Rubritepida sp.]
MALLIYGLDTEEIGSTQSWHDTLAELLPQLDIRIFPHVGNTSEITYLAFMRPDFDAIPPLPNLRAMFSRSAGVEAFIDHPKLPKAPLGKIEPADGDPMMTEYVIMHVLRLHREMPLYQQAQARCEWLRRPMIRPDERRIGFLGFGLMAKAPALVLKSLGFPVSAWVRNPKPDAEIPIFHGPDQFDAFMRQIDIAVCLLPLTRETEGILCARTFALMPRGAMVINIGRGRHLVHADLLAALDSGQLSYAALDALYPEPLPSDSPLWLHPKVTVMPHVARRPTVRQLGNEIAANIRSIEAGGGLLQEIDKTMGY